VSTLGGITVSIWRERKIERERERQEERLRRKKRMHGKSEHSRGDCSIDSVAHTDFMVYM